jgi:hypothetical protein
MDGTQAIVDLKSIFGEFQWDKLRKIMFIFPKGVIPNKDTCLSQNA